MSNTFDHESDAWEQHINNEDFCSSNYEYNYLYHHNFLDAKKVMETDKAYLFDDTMGKFWVPKKIIRTKDNKYYIWEGYDFDYIKEENLEEIEGDDIDFFEPIVTVVKAQSLENIPVKALEKIFIPEYEEYLKSESKLTYAEWCSEDLPF